MRGMNIILTPDLPEPERVEEAWIAMLVSMGANTALKADVALLTLRDAPEWHENFATSLAQERLLDLACEIAGVEPDPRNRIRLLESLHEDRLYDPQMPPASVWESYDAGRAERRQQSYERDSERLERTANEWELWWLYRVTEIEKLVWGDTSER